MVTRNVSVLILMWDSFESVSYLKKNLFYIYFCPTYATDDFNITFFNFVYKHKHMCNVFKKIETNIL